jgi:hypothetical protein
VKLFSVSQNAHCDTEVENTSLFDEFVRKLGLFWHAWAIILKREWNEHFKTHECQKARVGHFKTRVERAF